MDKYNIVSNISKVNGNSSSSSNLYKNKNETIDIFSTLVFENFNDNYFKMYKVTQIDNNYTSFDITPSLLNFININNSLTKLSITLPDEDCVVCCIYNNASVLIKVGEPSLRLFIHKPNLLNKEIHYKQYTINDDNTVTIRYQEVLEYHDNDIYSIDFLSKLIIEKNDYIELNIFDTILETYLNDKILIKVTKEVDSTGTTDVCLQQIYYEWE